MTNTLFAGSDQPLQFNHDVKRLRNSAGVKAMDRFDDLEQRPAAVELLFQNQSAENLELSATINRLRERVERQDKEIEALRHDTELLYHSRSNAIQMRLRASSSVARNFPKAVSSEFSDTPDAYLESVYVSCVHLQHDGHIADGVSVEGGLHRQP
ncbi:hypothetical protein VTN00DRAFT_8052 [Thermoascus crustaceus]|uniref:uncharacterized protein n=1 Tax=Thermoascus crustaceus TaxID=5088 RepID=UPI003744617D